MSLSPPQSAAENEKHRDQWTSTLKAYASTIYTRFGRGGGHGLGHEVLEPIWSTKPETASRVRQRSSVCCHGPRFADSGAGDNPAAWRGILDNLLPADRRCARVATIPRCHIDQIGVFMTALREATAFRLAR